MIEPSPALKETGWQALTRTKDVGAIFRSNGYPKRLLVTFDALSEFNHGRQRVSGDRVALDCEADHLHIGTTTGSWFQSPEIVDVIGSARTLRESYREVTLYGHSMGAYGALLLSGPLAATNVVAFSPQFSIDPTKVSYEQRFRSYAEQLTFVFDDMLASISRSAPKHVVFDPFSTIDRLHFDRIADVEGVSPVRIPFAGHYPGQMLHEGGVLRRMVMDLVLLNLSAAGRRRYVRAARRRSHRYLVERAGHVSRRGRFMDALVLMNAAYVLAPHASSVLETFEALLMSDSRYYGLAHAMIRLILKAHPNLSYYEDTLATVWREIESNARPLIEAPLGLPTDDRPAYPDR